MGALVYVYVALGIICGIMSAIGIVCRSIVKSNEFGRAEDTELTEFSSKGAVCTEIASEHRILFFQ
jgi:hypothetical protein